MQNNAFAPMRINLKYPGEQINLGPGNITEPLIVNICDHFKHNNTVQGDGKLQLPILLHFIHQLS